MRCFSQNVMSRLSLQMLRVVAVITFVALFSVSPLRGQEQSGVLTVKKIYGQPGLSGRQYRGVQWTPDGKTVAFFEAKGSEKDAKSELSPLRAQSCSYGCLRVEGSAIHPGDAPSCRHHPKP